MNLQKKNLNKQNLVKNLKILETLYRSREDNLFHLRVL